MTIGATSTMRNYIRTWSYNDIVVNNPFIQTKVLQLPFSATHPATYEWYQQLTNELGTGLYVVDVAGLVKSSMEV